MDAKQYKISNEEALLVAALGDQHALEIIRRNFRNFIKKTCGNFHLNNRDLNLDFDDLIFAGECALHHAMGAYNHGTPFAAFATTVIERGINTLVRSHRSLTNMMMRNAISFDHYFGDSDETNTLADIVGEEDIFTNCAYDTKMLEHIGDLVNVDIDERETLVVKERFMGYSFYEICERNKISRRKMAALVDGLKDKYEQHFE